MSVDFQISDAFMTVLNSFHLIHLKGLCEQTVKVLQLMEAEGIELNLVMLNVLINAFGTAGRHLEAVSVYHHIRDSVNP